jgi:hypothetical protein
VLTPQHNHPCARPEDRDKSEAKGATSNSGGLLALCEIVTLSALDRLSIAPLLIRSHATYTPLSPP